MLIGLGSTGSVVALVTDAGALVSSGAVPMVCGGCRRACHVAINRLGETRCVECDGRRVSAMRVPCPV